VENMADKKNDSQKAIEDYTKNYNKVKHIINTLKINHSKAYTTAADELLKDKKTGLYDLEKLEDSKIKAQFIKKVSEFYKNSAVEYFQAKGDDSMKNHQLISAYGGITADQMRNLLDTHGKNYDIELHENIRDQIVKETRGKLNVAAGAHLDDEHIKGVVGEAKADKLVNMKNVSLEDALTLYEIYRNNKKSISADAIKDHYRANGKKAPVYLLKEEKASKEYKMAS
jgi:hypothetical protein